MALFEFLANVLLWWTNFFHDSARLARIRINCIKQGHRLLCNVDGHLCTRCGRFWGFYD